MIANTKRLKTGEETFRQQLLKSGVVINASISSSIPTRVNFADTYVPEQSTNDNPLLKEIGLSSFVVDENFLSTYKMLLLTGRNFSKTFSDSASVILNETAANMIGWKEAVGKTLQYPGNNQQFKVIAVVKDFAVSSLHDRIEPFALLYTTSNTYDVGTSYITVQLQNGSINKQMDQLANSWKVFAPNTLFDFSFLNSDFDALYRSEQRMGTALNIFTFLSIFIACLGLFGLAVYTAARRVKEIGVRKVLGASVLNIVVLLSKDFILLVLFAAVIAFPVAWYTMSKWLQDFAYRISIGWEIFLVAGLCAAVISLATVSFQAIKAALANPVNNLRSE